MTPHVGDPVTVENHEGDTFTLVIEERVFIDPTCGQWESGWLAYRPEGMEDPDSPVYFISDGDRRIVYGPDDDGNARDRIGWVQEATK